MIKRGGQDEQRLYLEDLNFKDVEVSKTALDVGMEDLIVRHKARYYPVGLFLRPGYSLLDFPCGSGYAAAIFRSFNLQYDGRDNDFETIEYASRIYGDEQTIFHQNDLREPWLEHDKYDVIACIEGLEHIDREYQIPAVQQLYESLKATGTLIISSPEAQEQSGPNPQNPFHKWELTKGDFIKILLSAPGIRRANVEIITHRTYFHTGQCGKTLYGICHKE